MRARLSLSLAAVFFAGCSLVGFDDLVTDPCIAGADRSIESFRAGNELCANIESMRPAMEGSTWVCREPIGEDLYCIESSADNDNDGVGTDAEGGLDCDDNDPEVFGGQEETLCDGKDNDCDGAIDENLLVPSDGIQIYEQAADAGDFSSGTDRISFIARGTQDVVVLLERGNITPNPPHLSGSFAAAPVGNEAILLTRPPGAPHQFTRTNSATTPTTNLMGEEIHFPAIGVAENLFAAAWFGNEAAACGAPAGPFRYTTGNASTGVDGGAPLDLPDASPVQAPVIVPVGERQFVIFAANGSSIDAHLVTQTMVVSSVSFDFDDTIAGFAVAAGESDGDMLTLGLSAVVGCGRSELVFRELLHDLTTGMTSLGELALTDDGDQPPSAPALRWSGSSPRGFLMTWVAGSGLAARLVGAEDFAGPAIDLGAAIDGAVAFPYGAGIGPASGGGVRVWTYARGADEGVYEIALGCGGV